MFDSFAAILELKPSSGASMEAVVYAYEFNTPREGGGGGRGAQTGSFTIFPS